MPTLCKIVQTNDALATLISENKEKFILIDFHATWCGPCKQIAPYLESLAGQHPDNLIIVKKYCVNMVWARDCGTVQRPRIRVISSFVKCHFGIKRIKSITYRSKCIFSTLFLGDTKFFWLLFLERLSKF